MSFGSTSDEPTYLVDRQRSTVVETEGRPAWVLTSAPVWALVSGVAC